MTPFSTPEEFYRERDFGQKISATFDFLRAHIQPLGRCLLYYALPVPLVGAIAAAAAAQLFFSSALTPSGGAFLPAMLLSWPPLILGYVLLILTTYGYVILRMDTPASQPVTPAMVGGWIKPRILPNLGAVLAVGILVMLGFILLLIPGIWLSMPVSLFFIVRLREDRTVGNALDRSINLIKGKWWSTFGLVFVMSLIASIIPFMVQMMLSMTIGILAGAVGPINIGNFSLAFFITSAISNMLSLMMYPLVLLALAFQYFNLRERKEGMGVYSLLDQLGQTGTSGTATHDYRPSVADEEGEY